VPVSRTDVGASVSQGLGADYYPTLDGWRAVAIVGVTVAHVCYPIFGPDGSHPNTAAFALTRYGALGVDLFFGISGFLICSRLLRELEVHGRISFLGFYIRRTFRILPPYFVTVAVLAALGFAGLLPISRQELWTSIVFVRNYLPGTESHGWYTAHFWSLAVEEHFYLLWPALLAWWGPSRAIRNVSLLALGVGFWRAFEFRAALLDHMLPGVSLYTRSDIRIDALLWGCCIALLLRNRDRASRWSSAAPMPIWTAAVAAFVLCVMASPPLAMMWQAMLIPIVLAGTVLRPQMLVGRVLEWGAVRWVGRLSYSLYLWQTPFFTASVSQTPLGLIQTFPFNLVGLLGAATISYYLIEGPMIRLGRRIAELIGRPAKSQPALIAATRPAGAM
jgi:peptidoglycan/LPS O-acetylase OafA/YrhL